MPEVIERVRFARISDTVEFAEVRLPGVNLSSLCVTLNGHGRLCLRAPTRRDRGGREWPAYSLQPGYREDVEVEIERLWHLGRG